MTYNIASAVVSKYHGNYNYAATDVEARSSPTPLYALCKQSEWCLVAYLAHAYSVCSLVEISQIVMSLLPASGMSGFSKNYCNRVTEDLFLKPFASGRFTDK